MKRFFVKTEIGLIPADDEAYESKKKLKNGVVYELDIKESRNYAFHRKYFALINLAWEFLPEDKQLFFREDKEVFRKTMELAAGNSELVYSLKDGTWIEQAKSIAFDKLSAEDFDKLYERVRDTIYDVIGSTHTNELEAELSSQQKQFEEQFSRF